MRLYEEIFKNTDGIALSRCLFVPKGGGYFEGVKSVGEFSPERVVLHFPKTSIAVEGKELVIKKYCEGDLEIVGCIECVKTEPLV